MLQALLMWLMNSNSMKTAGAAASGSIVSVVALMGFVDKNIDTRIESVNKNISRYVDSRHNQVSTDIKYIKENQKDMKQLLRIINDRLYNLKQGDR